MTLPASPELQASRSIPVWSLLGVVIAIAVTTAMDATGYFQFSALPLFPLMLVLWGMERLARRDMGWSWGRPQHYGIALLHPVVVIGTLALIATAAGAVDVAGTDWNRSLRHIAIATISTFLIAILTEEGFFRGWLWASLRKSGRTQPAVLIWSTLAFAAWHISPVALDTGFKPPPAQIPVLLANVVVLGLIWGLLRWISGSILVASASHGLWNGLGYVLFGFGAKTGALGIANTALYGPEVGIAGLALNLSFAAVLWRWWTTRSVGSLMPGSPASGLLQERELREGTPRSL